MKDGCCKCQCLPEPPSRANQSVFQPISTIAESKELRGLNFYTGPVDGIWGAATQQAIERFQQGRGLQVNGQLNPATIAALGLDPNVLVPSR